MNASDVERLVTELLATGEMNADTQTDLERILVEARAEQSHADDLDYLQALHARILSAGPVSSESEAAPVLRESVEDLRREIEMLRAELNDARQTIAELETRLATPG